MMRGSVVKTLPLVAFLVTADAALFPLHAQQQTSKARANLCPGRTNNFPGAVDQIFRESASYYLVGYTAPVNDDRLHKIDVKVERTGVTVRARRARR